MSIKNFRLSISKKLTLIYSLILLGILIIFTLLTFFSIRNFIIRDSQAVLSSNVDIILNYIASRDNIDENSFSNINITEGIYYTVYNDSGNIIFSNVEGKIKIKGGHQKNKWEVNEKAFEHKDGTMFESKTVTVNGKKYYIQAANRFEDIGNETEAITEIFVIISILGTLVCFVSGHFLTKRLLRPIKDITQTAKEITSKSLDKRLTTNGAEDEIKDLADTFNLMIERLEVDFEKQKRFVSDASHELRTPLAVMHGHVNMLNRWGKNDPEQLDKSLKILKNETENMNRLIESLLYLARGDNDVLNIKKERFQLNMLLKEVANETLISRENVDISYECENNLEITADYNGIKQVLRILVDNSIKFNKDNGKIILNAVKKQGGTVITVTDFGIGIPEESIPHIFDRFYRVDKSRTKTTGGTGLGLSIAKQIVEYHNGTISAESKLGEGCKISVFIP